MGLDIYCGPITRYVVGDWLTAVQQAGLEEGMRVEVVRPNQPVDIITDPDLVTHEVGEWQRGLLSALGLSDGWVDRVDGDYATDKPDWDGYGAVVLLAAYDERPDVAPGSTLRRGFRRSPVRETLPRDFGDAPAFKAASRLPQKYPTLLSGAEWCLPLSAGPTLFQAPTPNGDQLLMGRVTALHQELTELNGATIRLSSGDLATAREKGPPEPGSSVEAVAPFGIAVLLALAEYAVVNRVAWIMDY